MHIVFYVQKYLFYMHILCIQKYINTYFVFFVCVLHICYFLISIIAKQIKQKTGERSPTCFI